MPDGSGRSGQPVWNEKDFKGFLEDLHCFGYGWLRAESVQRKIEELAVKS
jgi:hypothetical protein